MNINRIHKIDLGQPKLKRVWVPVLWLVLAFSLCAQPSNAPSVISIRLLTQAVVDSQGVFLDQLVENGAANPTLHLRVAPAPAFGQAVVLTSTQILASVKTQDVELVKGEWTGAQRVRVARRTRILREADLKEMLLAVLQRDYVRDRGELEVNLTRAWTPAVVPDEALELKVLDAPVAGVSPSCILRFELLAGRESIGKWQTTIQAKIWSEVWVAAAPLKRGQLLSASDLVRERRDVLSLRDLLVEAPTERSPMELIENFAAGAPVWQRSVRARAIVHRGEMVDALIQDGFMSVSLKVEALEEGAFGQAIRVRNPETRRELRGKIQNEKTVLVSL
jgi:flagellar basal body P-ring formation protein FlgA